MELNFIDNSCEFELNFNFYDYISIVEAAAEFTDSCFVSIKGSEDENSFYIRIEPKNKDIDVKDAVYSFFNYILGIMTRKIKNFEEVNQ